MTLRTLCELAGGLVAAAASAGAAGADGRWADCLAGGAPAAWAAAGRGEYRRVDGRLEVRTPAAKGWTTVRLWDRLPAAFELEVELRWAPRPPGKSGSAELAVGPHGVGSAGYRLVAGREPWRAAECRGPALAAGQWHSVRLRGGPRWIEYALDGRAVARCAVADGGGRLAVVAGPATTLTVRRCRVRARSAEEEGRGGSFVYAAEWFGHGGRAVDDAAARGGRAVDVAGGGARRWLVWGQDGSLPADGAYAAVFALRGVRGVGPVRLLVVRAGVGVVAERVERLEELPVDGYRLVSVPFRCQAGWTMAYRVAAAADGVLRVAGVEVSGPGGQARRAGAAAGPRERRPPALAAAWPARAKRRFGRGLWIERLERPLAAQGAHRVGVVWRQRHGAAMEDVAVDMWVACRDQWGRVKTFDYGVAYDAVGPGEQATWAELDGRRCRFYGPPVALFVQLYRGGVPAASAWRKWGIPVENKWILPAQRTGRLNEPGG